MFTNAFSPTLGARLAPLLFFCLAAAAPALAQGTYQAPQAFIEEAFSSQPPAPRLLWLTGAIEQGYRHIMQEPPARLRLRYWANGQRSAWVLESIGKEHPITAGFVIDAGRISQARVLIFRESRGWEIRHAFFTDQFHGSALNERQELDRHIDGITGATLSVRAMERMARLALYLDQLSRTTP